MKVTRSARKSLRTGVRWKKGQSSSSNPRCVRFREAASAKAGRSANVDPAPATAGRGLTTAELRRFDDRSRPADSDAGDSDAGQSDATWATNFTGCTNQCFGQVVANWSARQNSEQRRQALAVLAAVSQLIRDRGGQETNEEYLQALITALASVDAELRQPAAYLLSVLMRRTQPQSVAAAFPAIARVCQQLLAESAGREQQRPTGDDDDDDDGGGGGGGGGGLTKSLLLCLGRGLGSLSRPAWHSAATRQCLQSLLLFCFADRPRVRKAALLAAAEATSACDGSFRAPAALVAAFANERLRDSRQQPVPALRLLAACVGSFAEKQARAVVEALLPLLPMSDSATYSEAMRVLRGLFWSCGAGGGGGLSAQLAGQSLTALYDVRPPTEDAGSTNAWLDTMRAGVGAVASLRQSAPATEAEAVAEILDSHLLKLFNASFGLLADCREESRATASGACHQLLTDTVGKAAEPLRLAAGLLRVLQRGLSYQYHAVWPHVSQLLAAFLRCYGRDCCDLVGDCLRQLAELRDSVADKEAAACLERALAAGIEELGPRRVLASAPLELEPGRPADDWTRSWLLPLLRRHVQRAEIAFFVDELLPLAERCAEAADACAEAQPARAKQLRLLELQVWDTLPAFCQRPVDSRRCLPALAKRLGQLLTARPDLRQQLLAAVRRLLASAQLADADADDEAAAEAVTTKELMTAYAKNFMPRLFGLYCSNECRLRQSVLETVRAYAPLCPQQLLAVWFAKAREKASASKETERQQQEAWLSADLLVSLAPSLPTASTAEALQLSCDWCGGSEGATLQKKGYRLLQELLKAERSRPESGRAEELAARAPELLLSAQDAVAPASRKCRLRCLVLLLDSDWLDDAEKRRLSERALPEAVLATTEQNVKAREAADALICHIFNFFAGQEAGDAAESAGKFLTILFESSSGSEEALLAALRAVSGLLPHLRLVLTRPMLQSLLQRLADSLGRGDCSRALAKASLRCLLVVARRLSHLYSLDQVAACLSAVPPSYQPVFRATTRRILAKLYATFPYESLRSELPAYCQKVLANVRKRTDYRERRRQSAADDSASRAASTSYHSAVTRVVKGIDELLASSDSEADAENRTVGGRSRRSSTRRRKSATAAKEKAWLEEEAGQILDLNDAAAAAKIHRTRPLAKKPSAKEASASAFKLAPDGRMIITDDPEDADANADKAVAKKKRRRDADNNNDDDDDYVDVDDDDDDDDDENLDDAETASAAGVYQPGGRGIHRPLPHLHGRSATAAATSKKPRPKKPKAKKASGAEAGLEPYSYLTLDRRLLGKRSQAARRQQLAKYKGLVRRGKKRS